MRKELLELVPVRFLCPFCGEWHLVKEPRPLKDIQSGSFKPDFKCADCVGCDECGGHRYWIYTCGDYIHYFVDGIRGKISISDIREESAKPRVVFVIPAPKIPYSKINPYCDLLQKDNDPEASVPGKITLGFAFKPDQFESVMLETDKDKSENTSRSLWGSQYDD